MCSIVDKIELQSHDPDNRLWFENVIFEWGPVVSTIENWFVATTLCVDSDGFSCRRFFAIDRYELRRFVRSLDRLCDSSTGEASLPSCAEPAKLSFKRNDLGHVFVSVAFNDDGELPHHFQVTFRTDQTVLTPLASAFRDVLGVKEPDAPQ